MLELEDKDFKEDIITILTEVKEKRLAVKEEIKKSQLRNRNYKNNSMEILELNTISEIIITSMEVTDERGNEHAYSWVTMIQSKEERKTD